jgi:hypothetical protein
MPQTNLADSATKFSTKNHKTNMISTVADLENHKQV